MKRVLVLLAVIILYSCSKGNGELIGVQGREEWYQPDPFGMLFIPMGSYNMGPSDQDVPYALTAQTRTVSVQAFYMDQTDDPDYYGPNDFDFNPVKISEFTRIEELSINQ